MVIKLFQPSINHLEKNAIVKVLKSKFWASGSGTGNVRKFEKKFQKFTNSDTCISVNSGTAALNLALSLCEIKNKEVILPSLGFVSSANAVLLNGGIPVFVDIDPKTLCIEPNEIESAITKKTKVVLPVHFGGFPCKLDIIQKLCRRNNLFLVEDAAHAVGSTFNKTQIGSHGDAVCFSFHPVKNLAMPTGGLISINNKNHIIFRKKLLSRRWCGITERKSTSYDVKEVGNNYYMNEFSAVIGLAQLSKLKKMITKRKIIAKKYFNELELEDKMPFSTNCSYHLYWISVKNRDKFRKILTSKGIESGTHYKPIHSFSLYHKNCSLPNTEKIGRQIVTIPIYPDLTNYEIDKIITTINKINSKF